LAGVGNYDYNHAFLHTQLPEVLKNKQNASVAIYNATDTAGLAGGESTLLKSYGYNVIKADSTAAVTNPVTTTIVDLSKGQDKYTLHYLENRFGVTAVDKLPSDAGVTPPVGVKFVIILGNDASLPSQ
jgi:hypothetical protein